MAVEITITRGDSRDLTISVQDADGFVFDLTGYTMTMTCKEDTSAPDTDAVFQIDAVVADPTSGIGIVHLYPEHTSAEPGTYYYDVQISNGVDKVYTVITPTAFTITQDVTKDI